MNNQLKDDFELLNLMNADMDNANELYKPTNYWAYKASFLMPNLVKEGLKDFRRKSSSVFSSFGGVDIYPSYLLDIRKSRIFNNRFLRDIDAWKKILNFLNKIINIFVNLIPGLKTYLIRKPYRFAKSIEKGTNAKSIDLFDASLAGNPEYVFKVNDKTYTNNIIDYYIRYVYCSKFINFDDIKVIVELGSGSCKLTEVIKKLHPHITFLLFDISPQLYVGESYLKEVFKDDVVSFRETREMSKIPELEQGKIYFFGSWQIPFLKDFKYDIFFNLTSFQEMEPNVVANYISFINGNSKYVYLHSKMDGKEIAVEKGGFGVLEQTTLKDFTKGFSKYKMIDIEDSKKETGEYKWMGHKDSFWVINE
jgi:putative sugar O-methyltransferase